ncbi:hypothetical protein [Psychrobacillus sp. OK032]|uniref:hypothetical protein n=1 Tax=Psychrobacillus sp. OK032 TaxID=1884358 RepID=UPI0008B9E566|nr:hypothetical protein [Psychrobacillus sp. OK032]SER91491.1 hypothetical protein SAMN05518872_102628 [Psychrobacillus sp. OK032]
MKKNNTHTAINKKMKNTVSTNYTEPEKLTVNEKKQLQVKDGQHNHHVDERGGF